MITYSAMAANVYSKSRSHQQRRSTEAPADMSAYLGQTSQNLRQSPGLQSPQSSSTPWATYLGLDGYGSGDETDRGHTPPETLPEDSQLLKQGSSAASVRSQLPKASDRFSQTLKRKASIQAWPRTTPVHSSKRRFPDTRPADTITINGEVYDRRRRPGSLDTTSAEDLDLQLLPYNQSYYPDMPVTRNFHGPLEISAREAFSSYRGTSPSNVSIATSLQSPPVPTPRIPSAQSAYQQLFDYEDLSFTSSSSSYVSPSGASAVGKLASPTTHLRLASALGQPHDTPKKGPASPQKPKLNKHPSAPVLKTLSKSGSGLAIDQHALAPPHPLLPIPPPSPSEVAETTLTGSFEENKHKPKRIRKRAPPKGTPQAAMSGNPGEPVHVARPPNAWILYRSDQLRIIRQDPILSRKPQADISKLIGALWREEKPEVKLWYEQQADIKKSEHLKAHPEYRFAPQRKDKNRPVCNTGCNKSYVSSSSASSSSSNTIPVLRPDVEGSRVESTPASTPTSGISPSQQQQQQDVQAFNPLSNPEFLLPEYLDKAQDHHLTTPFQFDQVDSFTVSNFQIDALSSASSQEYSPMGITQNCTLSTDVLAGSNSQDVRIHDSVFEDMRGVERHPSFDLNSSSVWADFLTNCSDRTWLPCGLREDSQGADSISTSDYAINNQPQSSTTIGGSEPLTPSQALDTSTALSISTD